MASIVPPDQAQPFVGDTGRMTLRVQTWAQLVSRLGVIEGEGSPEGVIDAPVTSLYMDTIGATGSILYIKRDTDIAGDGTQGWILV